MDNITVRHSKIKRVIITLLPAIFLLGIFLCATICTKCLEYGSLADHIVSNIGLFLFVPMFLSIPFGIKVNREKIVFDGNNFTVTPFIGTTRTIPLPEVKICTISISGKIKLFDKDSNLVCKYRGKQDEQKTILRALQRAQKCVFTFSDGEGRQTVAKSSDQIVLAYLATGKIMFPQESYRQMHGFQEPPYAEGEINEDLRNRLRKCKKRVSIGQIVCMMLPILGIILAIIPVRVEIIKYIAIVLFWGGILGIWLLDYYWRRKKFAVIQPTFYRVMATAEDEMDFSSKGANRHLIYEFQDKYGAVRRRPTEGVNASNLAWGTEVGIRKALWYSPYSEYLLETEPTKVSLLKNKKKLSLKEWIRQHPILAVSYIAVFASVSFYIYQCGKGQVIMYQNGGSELQTEWGNQGENMDEQVSAAVEVTGMNQEELEAWLKQSFYPYFYANDAEDAFERFDVHSCKDSMDEEMVQKIKDNLSESWGIHNRRSLIRVTDSLLKKGDKYTYSRTLDKMGEESMELPKDMITYTYKLYDPDEYYRYLGTYLAYNEIGDAGVDAWDYGRCIRLFAFGYLCGYISYDEYLIHAAPIAVHLQDEYDSWTQMYESYYYGHLIFLGRNGYTNVSGLYDNYSDYERMGRDVTIPFRDE